MSQSGRSDQSLSQGQAPDLTSEAALQQVLSERNALRSQNDQLWKLIEKQRIIIQNLQKDVAKVTAERDLLRHFAAESEGFKSNSLASASSSNSNANGVQPSNHVQVNGHHQHSRRTLERKAQEGDASSSYEQGAVANNDRDIKPDLVPHSPSSQSSSVSPTDLRLAQMDQPLKNRTEQDPHVPQTPQSATTPLTPSSTCGEAEGCLEDRAEESPLSIRPEDEAEQRYDPEVQMASTATRISHQAPLAASPISPAIVVERDGRALPPQAEFSPASLGHIPSPTTSGSPAGSRNVSGSISLGAIAQHLPHLPPRSPRRERRDMGDGASSPTASDNEDDLYPSVNGTRSKSLPQRGDLPPPLSQPGLPDQDTFVMSSSKSPTKHANLYDSPAGPASPDCELSQATNTYLGTATATRRMISAQIPTVSGTASLQTYGSQEPSASSLINMNPNSNPPSPIAAIIDQDAEKFRLYMSKLNSSSRKNVSAPIQLGQEGQDKAAALGQAVAMENIQNQLDIQNQLMGQVQGHGGRVGLNPVNGPMSSRGVGAAVSGPINVYEPALDSNTSRPSGDSHEQGSLADTLEKNGSQLSLPSEARSKKRESSLQLFDDYPKIAARSTSHQRDDDDSGSGHGLVAPIPPRRFDSQYQNDPARVASPTPSGNSSLTNTLVSLQASPGHSRAPTVYQQKFSTFTENLEFVSILVVGSNISTNDRGREQLTFLISIGQEERGEHDDAMYPHKEDDELWRVEKQYADFMNLDSKLRVTQSRNIVNSLPKLPDKSLFSTHAPSKVDARKVALEQYLQQVTSLRIKDTRDLCEFLSTNVVEREKRREGDSGWKEGYLTKRGKNFGGWKTRYFMLRGPVLEYFDSKDGHHLGSIALTNAQIGRQQSQDKSQEGAADGSNTGTADPNSYRHAFLILEPKKGQTVVDAKKNPNSVIRHVLCAETDQERDDWVEALMLYVGKDPSDVPDATHDRERSGRKIPEIQKLSATPIKELQSVKGNEKLLLNQEAYERQQRSVPPSQCPQQLNSQGRGGPIPQSPTTQGMSMEERNSAERPSDDNQYPSTSKGNSPLQQQQQQIPRSASSQSLPQDDGSLDGQGTSPYLSTTDAAEKKQKSRMTFWAKKNVKEDAPVPMPSSSSQTGMLPPTGATSSQPSQDSSRLRHFLGKGNNSASNINGTNTSVPPGPGSYPSLAPIRQVFGVTLEQAIEQAQVQPGYELPAVVYRCIEYLNAHKAKLEEGIYRLNGSAAVIKGLKERFNHDGDVALLAEEEYYDIHAVAGLLKLFLRDLPSSILTRELHRDFLQVIELTNRSERVDELTRLVAVLPEANYTLLRALTAHLIEIVDNADVNKMTARNVGIVFSPTLGIPAGVFALLMSDFDQIFHTDDGRIMPLENSDMQANRGPAPIAVLPVSATPPPHGSVGLASPPDACMGAGTGSLAA